MLPLLGAVAGYLWWSDHAAEQDVQGHRDAFATLNLQQAVRHCHALWTAGHFDQPPLALAWQPGLLEWYVLAGDDTQSMRHWRCDGAQVETGQRYERVWRDRVPSGAGWPNASWRGAPEDFHLLHHHRDQTPAEGLIGLEAIRDPRDPASRVAIERRWFAGGGAQVHGPEDLRAFGVLFSRPLRRPAGAPQDIWPPLRALPRHDWQAAPDAAMTWIGDVVGHHEVVWLGLDQRSIQLVIRGPIAQAEGRSAGRYGEARFDEHGVRESSGWIPRDEVDGACTQGRRLDELRRLLPGTKNLDSPRRVALVYGCPTLRGRDGAEASDPAGQWLARLARRR